MIHEQRPEDMPTPPRKQAQSHVFVQSAGPKGTRPPHGCHPPGVGPTQGMPSSSLQLR